MKYMGYLLQEQVDQGLTKSNNVPRHMQMRIAMRSPRISHTKIKAALLAAGRNVHLLTVSIDVITEFEFSLQKASGLIYCHNRKLS